jgi:hypothetical protein
VIEEVCFSGAVPAHEQLESGPPLPDIGTEIVSHDAQVIAEPDKEQLKQVSDEVRRAMDDLDDLL